MGEAESWKSRVGGAKGCMSANDSSKTQKTSSNKSREESAEMSKCKILGSYRINESASVYVPGLVENVGANMLFGQGFCCTSCA